MGRAQGKPTAIRARTHSRRRNDDSFSAVFGGGRGGDTAFHRCAVCGSRGKLELLTGRQLCIGCVQPVLDETARVDMDARLEELAKPLLDALSDEDVATRLLARTHLSTITLDMAAELCVQQQALLKEGITADDAKMQRSRMLVNHVRARQEEILLQAEQSRCAALLL